MSKRSANQNALYWLWLTEISEQASTTDEQKLSKDDWHYLCSLRFLGFRDLNVAGFNYRLPSKSTSKLKVSEFAEYLGEIEAEFVSRGVTLTFPDYYEDAMGHAKEQTQDR